LFTSNIRSSVDIGSDGAASFGDKINLSNTTNADSWKAEIDSDANSVVVRRYDFIVDLQIKRMKNKVAYTNRFGSSKGRLFCIICRYI
jgi:hypothetical protein